MNCNQHPTSIHNGGYRTKWITQKNISQVEMVDSLCDEIEMLFKDSEIFEEQYKSIITKK